MIDSVMNQTYKNWEWWIIDDASSDNTVKILNEYTDNRMHLILSAKNSGAAVARNKGIEKATGRYITFIDSDDIWMPEFLEKSVNFLKQNNEELVYASYKRVDEDLKPLLSDFIAEDFINLKRLLYNCPIPMLTAIYDSQRIGKIEIPIIDLREDYAMWIRVLNRIPRARAIKEPLAIYRIHKMSYSRNKYKILRKQFIVYYKFLKLSLPKSIYYTLHWTLNGIKKYEKLKL